METQIFRQFFNRRNVVKNETVKDNDNEKKKTFSTMSADVAKHFSQQSAFHVRIMVFFGGGSQVQTRHKAQTENKLKVNKDDNGESSQRRVVVFVFCAEEDYLLRN